MFSSKMSFHRVFTANPLRVVCPEGIPFDLIVHCHQFSDACDAVEAAAAEAAAGPGCVMFRGAITTLIQTLVKGRAEEGTFCAAFMRCSGARSSTLTETRTCGTMHTKACF